MAAPPNYMFTVIAFVGFFLCLIRFPMQLHTGNIGTHLFLVWIGLNCIFLGTNSIIWNHNTVNWAPVWCDIMAKFEIGVSIAVPAAILCINRRLYLLAWPTSILPSQADGRREFMIDLLIGIGLPIIHMILSFFAQNSRFLIVEDFGCTASLSNTWVSIVIISVPPILLTVTAGVYDCLCIYAFYKRRSKLNEFLSTHQHINSNRYIRLMCFSALDLIIATPFAIAYLYFATARLSPYLGLTQEHYHFSRVVQVPAAIWRADVISELGFELRRWLMISGAFVFFAIFGFTEESRNNYRAVLHSVLQVFTTMTGVKVQCSSSKIEELTFKAASRDLPVDTLDSQESKVTMSP